MRGPVSLVGALLLAVAGVVLVGVAGVPATAPAAAVDQSKGRPGFCPDDTGVTVVIDFQELGGEPVVRCNPTGSRGTGLDALQGSGIQVDGVQRWGLAFVCRVENRPSAVETLPIRGDEDYRERCIDTPPASGYWSYWHAGNNCAWTYSQWGVKNRDFVPGGFEGWSFSLNAGSDSNPKPRIAAVRPGSEGGACVEPKEAAPSTDDPLEQQPGSSADSGYVPDPEAGDADQPAPPSTEAPDGASGASASPGPPGGSAGREDLPPPLPQDPATGSTGSPGRPDPPTDPANTADDPADNVEFTDGEAAPDVRDAVKDQVNASDVAPWVAAGVMLLLAALALLTARRRQRARDGA